MNTVLVNAAGIVFIVFLLAYARWQGKDDQRRQKRIEQRRSWTIVSRCEEYGYRFDDVDACIDRCLEEAA